MQYRTNQHTQEDQMDSMDTTKQGTDQRMPRERSESCVVDGKKLYRFTFERTSPDLSEAFYNHVTVVLSKMGYNHITIRCPGGHPDWLVKMLRDFEGFGLPVDVTPAPTDPALLEAIAIARGRFYIPLQWPADSQPD
jgi:hypothetical protein